MAYGWGVFDAFEEQNLGLHVKEEVSSARSGSQRFALTYFEAACTFSPNSMGASGRCVGAATSCLQ